MSRFGAATFIVLTGLWACHAAPLDGESVGSNEADAVVSQPQADRAYEIVRGIDYLPWGYTDDGCYARALYMSMELAVERIPSSAQYLWGKDGASFAPDDGAIYSWHVAPMIKVTTTGTPMIIDPSLFGGPIVARSLDVWIARNNPQPANDYELALIQGSHYFQINQLVDTQPIESFAALDPFQGADIESACDAAWRFLEDEKPAPSAGDLARKRAKLIDRTRVLVTGLRNVSKLSDLTAEALRCGGHAVP